MQFIKDQADQIEDDPSSVSTKHPQSEKRVKYQQHQKYTGSTHSIVTPLPVVSYKGGQQRQSSQSYSRPPFTNNTSVCSLCQGSHHLFYCPTFEGYTLPQRKEHVMSLKLCLNCLKPNHVAHDCRSSYRCKAKECGRKHNTLLHEERLAAPTQQQSHQSNATIHSEESEEEEFEECLLMTSQVTLTGPTGKSITVRALLDAGSTLSIVSSKLMKFLSLKKTGKHVSVTGISARSTQRDHPLAKVTISSEFKRGWSKRITVAGMDEVIRQLPLQGAHSVRNLGHIKNLTLADERFDEPGRIDLLLGQNVWRHLFLEGKVKGEEDQPEAWLTVFGWTILGTYNPSNQTGSQSAITYVVSPAESSLLTDQLLTRFWELEEPSVYQSALTPSEIKVEKHFEQTHSYDSTQKKYMVRLPRSEGNFDLGESRTQALNRARANERSLIRKEKLPQFQAVMQEYLDLGHAQPVSVKNHQPTA